MSTEERDGDIESEIDDETGEVRVKAAPRGVASEAASSNGTNGTNGHGASTPRTSRRSHHATSAAAGVGSAPANADPPNAEMAPWSYKEADLMLGEILGGEHPRSLVKYGKTPYDFHAEVRRSDGVGGQSVCIKTIPGQDLQGSADMTPGEVLRNIVGDVHLVSAKGPVKYDIWYSWRSPQRQYGKGQLQMPAPEEIIALRNAQRQIPQQPYQPQYQPPPAQPQQPPVGYGAAPVSNQRPPYQPPPEYHPDGNPYGRRHDAPPSRDAEIGNLRAEIGELRGAVGQQMQAVDRIVGFLEGGGRGPVPQAPPAAPPQGFGAPPDQRPWPRPQVRRRDPDDIDELRDDIDELRAELEATRRGGGGRSGFGAPPAAAAAAPPVRAADPPPVPRGPNGEIWIERIGWCIPKDQASQAQAPVPVAQPVVQPAPAPAAAPPVQQQAPATTQAAAGVGAMPVNPLRTFIEGARAFIRDGRDLSKVADELQDMLGGGTGAAGLGGAAEDPPAPEKPEEPESVMPFASEVVGGDGPDAPKLFGQPIRYTVDKETGKFDIKGFAFANPGVMEKGVEIAGIVAEGFRNLTAKAVANSGTAAQFPAGVAGAPAQVVDNIPEDAKPAGGGGSGFPRV